MWQFQINFNCAISVSRMMYLLDPSSQESAISLATALDSELEEVNLKVNLFQIFNISIHFNINKGFSLIPIFWKSKLKTNQWYLIEKIDRFLIIVCKFCCRTALTCCLLWWAASWVRARRPPKTTKCGATNAFPAPWFSAVLQQCLRRQRWR